MMSSYRKRRHQHARRASPNYDDLEETTSQVTSPQGSAPNTNNVLFVQAHEAIIVRDRPALAEALMTHDHGSSGKSGGGKGGLIQWHGDGPEPETEVWVDRYDARLLLTTLPGADTHNDETLAGGGNLSPTGWSDLPSDSEDTFFFTPTETEEYRGAKRRKLVDVGRQERLRALREIEPDPVFDYERSREKWGGDDEEPDTAQYALMERTAKHLLTSSDPAQLEMRILANHGAHERFAFLRGRWKKAWDKIKLAAQAEKDGQEKEKRSSLPVVTERASALQGSLVTYDSDSDESNAEMVSNRSKADEEEERKREERRKRAREWTKQKRAIG